MIYKANVVFLLGLAVVFLSAYVNNMITAGLGMFIAMIATVVGVIDEW